MHKEPFSGRIALALMLSAATLILSGCVKTTASEGINVTTPAPAAETYCSVAKPIPWSTRDTDETIRDVKAHNAVYVALCGKP